MSAPRSKWIAMNVAMGIIRRETHLPDRESEPALLEALAGSEIHSQYTVIREIDIPSGGFQPGPTKDTPIGFWRQQDFRRQYEDHRSLSCVPLYRPNDREGWNFEVNYSDLLKWLNPTNRKTTAGRPPIWDWEAFWIEAVLLANKPDGLPDTQAGFVEHMAVWFEGKHGASPSDSQIKERASKLYNAKADK